MNENDKTAEYKRASELRAIRSKNIKKLTKLLASMVKIEWEIISSAHKMEDNISKISAESVANASGAIQGAISHLISTKTDKISYNNVNNKNSPADISTLKNTLKSSKLM